MTDPVAAAADRWRDASAAAAVSKAELAAVVQAEATAGASEYELARRAGVTRNTVRAWLGKGGHRD